MIDIIIFEFVLQDTLVNLKATFQSYQLILDFSAGLYFFIKEFMPCGYCQIYNELTSNKRDGVFEIPFRMITYLKITFQLVG